MSRRRKSVAVAIALALIAIAVAGCSQQGPASKPATERIQSNTESRNETITAAIDKAEGVVSEVASATATDAGSGASDKLRQIERQLTDASNKVGQAQIDAVTSVSASFTQLIGDVDSAAAKAPAGSAKQQALTRVSTRLRSAQTSLTAAIGGSSESSGTP